VFIVIEDHNYELSFIHFPKVVDKDMKTGEALAMVRISCKELARETMISGWKTLVNDKDKVLDSYIKFTLSYTAADELSDGLAVGDW
jgi:hypothetical protein